MTLLVDQDAADVLAFERANREFFASWVGDRGDDWFATYVDRHRALAAENRDGKSRLYLVRDAAGEVIGRVNLYDIDTGTPDLGYRIAESAQGRGLATAATRQALKAAFDTGVTMVRAKAIADNVASQKVLEHLGFERTDEPCEVEREGRSVSARLYRLTQVVDERDGTGFTG